MKKIYDKLLLLLAILALLGGAAFYVLKSDTPGAEGAGSMSPQAADNPYEPVPIPALPSVEVTWPEPEPQSSGPNWHYDVFTPPKIYLDSDGNFTAEPPIAVGPPEPFGIYLASIERKPYRIQMQGFSGDRDKPEEAVLFFFDEERELRFFIREGETNAEAEVEVLDFTIRREINEEAGSVEVIAIAKILDKRTGKEVKLNDEERLFNPEVSVLFLSEQDPGTRVELIVKPEEPETSFETSAGEFVLKQINLEQRSVTIEKLSTEEREAQVRTLTSQTSDEPEVSESETEEPSEEASGQQSLEDLF